MLFRSPAPPEPRPQRQALRRAARGLDADGVRMGEGAVPAEAGATGTVDRTQGHEPGAGVGQAGGAAVGRIRARGGSAPVPDLRLLP